MSKKIKITENDLINMIEKLVEQETGIESDEVLRALDKAQMLRHKSDDETSSDIEDLKMGLSGAEDGARSSPFGICSGSLEPASTDRRGPVSS